MEKAQKTIGSDTIAKIEFEKLEKEWEKRVAKIDREIETINRKLGMIEPEPEPEKPKAIFMKSLNVNRDEFENICAELNSILNRIAAIELKLFGK